MDTRKICAVILAAGKGTRMKSNRAKVLHHVFGQAMIRHVVDRVRRAGIDDVVVVTGHQGEQVESCLAGSGVRFARQQEQLGTGHAVLSARRAVREEADIVVVLCGDTPLIEVESISAMLASHRDAAVTVMTTVLDDPTNYGRIITDEQGNVLGIVEEKDADDRQRAIREVNAGIYCVERDFLFTALGQVTSDNRQGELYLTDIVAIGVRQGRRVQRFLCPDPDQVLGVNSRQELARAQAVLQQRKNRQLMAAGVTLVAPGLAFIDPDVEIGADSTVHANVHLRGRTFIGRNCTIEPFCLLEDCRIGDNVHIGAGCHLAGSDIDSDCPAHTVMVGEENAGKQRHGF